MDYTHKKQTSRLFFIPVLLSHYFNTNSSFKHLSVPSLCSNLELNFSMTPMNDLNLELFHMQQ